MLTTRCPSCNTVFRVRPEQLTRRGGRVRCGKCRTAFSALASLEEIAENEALIQKAAPPERPAAAPMRAQDMTVVVPPFPEFARTPPATEPARVQVLIPEKLSEPEIPVREVKASRESIYPSVKEPPPGFISSEKESLALDETPEQPSVKETAQSAVSEEKHALSLANDDVPFFVDIPAEPYDGFDEMSGPSITAPKVSVPISAEQQKKDQDNGLEAFIQQSMASSIETVFSNSIQQSSNEPESVHQFAKESEAEPIVQQKQFVNVEPSTSHKNEAPTELSTEAAAGEEIFRIDFDFNVAEEPAEVQASVNEWPPLGTVGAALKKQEESRHDFSPGMFDGTAQAERHKRTTAAKNDVYGLEPEFNVDIEFSEAFDKEAASKPEAKQRKDRSKSRRLKSKSSQSSTKGEKGAENVANDELATKLQVQNTVFLHDEVLPAGGRKKRYTHTALWSIGCLLMIGGLLVQLTYVFRNDLVRSNPELRPSIEAICGYFGCVVPYSQDIRLINVVGDLPRLQSANGNLYRMEATLTNNAAFAQQWPSIELTLTDTLQRVVARRVFTPKEWLPAAHIQMEAFQPQDEVVAKISLQIDQPVDGYNVRVLYP